MRRHRLWTLGRCCGGTAALEFALVAPAFLALLIGSIELGRALWTRQALQETASAGARCMAIAQGKIPNGPCTSVAATQSHVVQIAGQWGISLATGDITPTQNAPCGGPDPVFSQVSISKQFVSVAPLAFFFPAGGISLTASACYPQNS